MLKARYIQTHKNLIGWVLNVALLVSALVFSCAASVTCSQRQTIQTEQKISIHKKEKRTASFQSFFTVAKVVQQNISLTSSLLVSDTLVKVRYNENKNASTKPYKISSLSYSPRSSIEYPTTCARG